MIDCQIIGDSIAVGVAQQLAQCTTVARVGVSASQYVAVNRNGIVSDSVLISLGSNGSTMNLERDLTELRSRVTASRVVWLLPANNRTAASIAATVARRYGDSFIDVANFVSSDGVHPTRNGYSRIADQFLGEDRRI